MKCRLSERYLRMRCVKREWERTTLISLTHSNGTRAHAGSRQRSDPESAIRSHVRSLSIVFAPFFNEGGEKSPDISRVSHYAFVMFISSSVANCHRYLPIPPIRLSCLCKHTIHLIILFKKFLRFTQSRPCVFRLINFQQKWKSILFEYH